MRDTKDWTWVLERPCGECGFDPAAVRPTQVGARIRAGVPRWVEVLAGGDAATRPSPQVWSPLEYACHVRDVHRVFGQRVARVLAEDDPLFASWDQDEAAIAGHYERQDPGAVARELAGAAEVVAATYDAVGDDHHATWSRPGRRGGGSLFTLGSLAAYHLHDVEHHVWDVRGARCGQA